MARHIPAYGIFIIESMDWSNERNQKLGGFALKTILDLSDIPSEYMYIRTHQEFEYAIQLFAESDFNILHIACHGDDKKLDLTMDEISFEELGEMLGPYLKYRRLFLSSCEAACFELAEYFIPQYHCYSVIGPAGAITYDKAAILWSSFYYLMYEVSQDRMSQIDIMPKVADITRTFSERLNYFSIIKEEHPQAKDSLREVCYENGFNIHDRIRKTAFENKYWADASG